MTSSARTILRPLVGNISAAAAGSAVASLPCRIAGPSVASSASSRARSAGSVPGNSRLSIAARTYRPDPPTMIAVRPRP